jgi:multisubunit Na+/H+ antiporter MnhE subunit
MARFPGQSVAVGKQNVLSGALAWFDRGVGRRGRFLVAEAAVWGILLFAGYLALVSQRSGSEIVLGALLSAIAGGATVLARRMTGSGFAVPQGWPAVLLRLPAAVLADTWLLVRLIWRVPTQRASQEGGLRTLQLAGQPDELREQSWQAVGGLLLSLSPGSFVVDSSGHPATLVVHGIRADGGLLERSMRR